MSTYLQNQIKHRMDENHLTIYALEKKAGLNRSAVRNILQGFSKNPSVEILRAISIALDCNIIDLIGSNENSEVTLKSTSKPKAKESYMWNEKLYINVVETTSKLITEKNIQVTLEQMNNFINEIYKYSLSKNSDHADSDFSKWLINKSI